MDTAPRTVVRAVTLPVGAFVNGPDAEVKHSWETVRPALNAAWRLATDLANWCVREMYVREPQPYPRSGRVPFPFGAGNGLYAHAVATYPAAAAWAGCKGSFAETIRGAEAKYRTHREAVMRQGDASLMRFRFPFPFPVRAQEAGGRLSYADGGFPVATLPIPGLGRVAFRLKRGAEFGRQLAMFRELHDGTAKLGQCDLYRNGKGDLLLKLVGHFPRRERATERTHAMLLRTDPAALLVAEIDGRSPWILNGDHLRRWQAAHRAYLRRTGEELKREKRMDPRQRAGLTGPRELRCEKHRHRLGTAVHQITAQVARFAERQRVGVVVFDDHERRFLPDGFPWHMLGERLAYKLDEIGVHLVSRDSVAPGEFDAWLADRSLVRATAQAGRRLVAGVNRPGKHPAVTSSTGSRSRPRRSRAASARP
jgi:hypothetical protein